MPHSLLLPENKKHPMSANCMGCFLFGANLGQIAKTRSGRIPAQFRRANFAVTVFGDDHFGDALLITFGVIVLIAVEEHHDIGILLD